MLIKSKLDYASVAWNSVATTGAKNLKHIQQKFAALFLIISFPIFITVILMIKAVKITHLMEDEVSCPYAVPYSKIPYFCILPFYFGSWWASKCCSDINEFSIFSIYYSSKIIILLNVLHLLMLFARTLLHLERKMFIFIAFCSCIQDYCIHINIYIHSFQPHHGWHVSQLNCYCLHDKCCIIWSSVCVYAIVCLFFLYSCLL